MYNKPELGFELDALEPYMDRENLDIHYNKHHSAYVKKFNDAVEGTEYADKPIEDLIKDIEKVSENLRTAIRNNGGGALNHSFFWSVLAPSSDSGEPGEQLKKAIEDSFESFNNFKKQFSEAAVSVFGSGWAWLVVGENGLEIMKTSNQDSPLSVGKKPILCLDVWEHAYYLKYRNLRPDFVEAFFKIINWKKVEEYFLD
jgi:Fe-Mn family superoxide dismutase